MLSRGSATRILERTRCGALLHQLNLWQGLLALAYHRIGLPSGSLFDHGLWSATPAGFEAQLRSLKRNCDVVGTGDIEQALKERKGRFALITFDDGYRDNYEVAFPILKSQGLSAAFFVTTGFVDKPRLSWWDEVAWMVHTTSCASTTDPME